VTCTDDRVRERSLKEAALTSRGCGQRPVFCSSESVNLGSAQGIARYAQSYNNPFEELWAEKIASWSWRLRRRIRFESGQIARALAEHSHEVKQLSEEDSIEFSTENFLGRSCR